MRPVKLGEGLAVVGVASLHDALRAANGLPQNPLLAHLVDPETELRGGGHRRRDFRQHRKATGALQFARLLEALGNGAQFDGHLALGEIGNGRVNLAVPGVVKRFFAEARGAAQRPNGEAIEHEASQQSLLGFEGVRQLAADFGRGAQGRGAARGFG
jgi:hypothetical protein